MDLENGVDLAAGTAVADSFLTDFNDPFSACCDPTDSAHVISTKIKEKLVPYPNCQTKRSSKGKPTRHTKYESMIKQIYAEKGLDYAQSIANTTPELYLNTLKGLLHKNPMFTQGSVSNAVAVDKIDTLPNSTSSKYEVEVELVEEDEDGTTLAHALPSDTTSSFSSLSKMLDSLLPRDLSETGATANEIETSATLHPQTEPKKFRNRPLQDTKVVFDQNAWDDVKWDDEQVATAKEKVAKNGGKKIRDFDKSILENNASAYWDKFYGVHQNKFFKNRRWLFVEFPELQSSYQRNPDYTTELEAKRSNESFPGENSKFRILEVGCGNGSTVFPLLELNADEETYVYCCDFSESAVNIVKESSSLDTSRCTPFVWDITDESFNLPFPPNSIDVVTMIFVLSAISPEKFRTALTNIHKILKPGGLLLFRDYGLHDLVQLRLPEGRCISDNFYFRGDSTRVYFFTEDEIESLFQSTNFNKISLFTDRRLQVNRLKQLKMFRIWVQGKFVKV